jgi:hypothetical protein
MAGLVPSGSTARHFSFHRCWLALQRGDSSDLLAEAPRDAKVTPTRRAERGIRVAKMGETNLDEFACHSLGNAKEVSLER